MKVKKGQYAATKKAGAPPPQARREVPLICVQEGHSFEALDFWSEGKVKIFCRRCAAVEWV